MLMGLLISRLWSRLILHFWALEAEKDAYGGTAEPKPICYLSRALQQTIEATSKPNEWLGTTTACSALLHASDEHPQRPLLYVTQLGDSQIMIVRPRAKEIIYKTKEQWHWFDCPRQLGTNSPDTPKQNAVVDKISIEENDVVLAMSDGVADNLWEHEVLDNVVDSMHKWEQGDEKSGMVAGESSYADGMRFVAQELVKAARVIAEDPFAESPFMERSIEEGLATEGGEGYELLARFRNADLLPKGNLTTSALSRPFARNESCPKAERQKTHETDFNNHTLSVNPRSMAQFHGHQASHKNHLGVSELSRLRG